MKFDTSKDGLYTFFKPYQVELLEHIWELNKHERVGINTAKAHAYVLTTQEKRSRASVIFFLNDMVDAEIMEYEERTGKGGHQKVYFPTMSRAEFAVYATDKITSKLREVF